MRGEGTKLETAMGLFQEEIKREKERQNRIRSLEGMIRKGGPQAEQAKKALFRLMREEKKDIETEE